MKTHLALLLGGVAGLLTVNAAQALPGQALSDQALPGQAAASPQSYAELLEPVPNAKEALIADEMDRAGQPKQVLQFVQFRRHHHHHHHHHHGFFPGAGIYFGSPGYAYGDCYWRSGPPFWNGWRWVRRRVRVCD